MPTWAKWGIGLGCSAALLAGVAFALLAGWVSGQPRDWTAEATVEVAVPPSLAHAAVADPKRWPQGSAWSRDADEDVDRSYSGADSGAGAQMHWTTREATDLLRVGGPVQVRISSGASKSEHDVGTGTLRIVAGDREHGLTLETVHERELVLAQSERGDLSHSHTRVQRELLGESSRIPGTIRFQPKLVGTRVVWSEHGDLGPGLSAGMWAKSMRGLLASQHDEILETSLRRLEEHLEQAR